MKHIIPLETHVSFEGDSTVYIVSDYTQLLGPCPADCTTDHDCYEEAYICVRKEIRTALPLSKLEHIFGKDHNGVKATPRQKQGVDW